MKNTLWVAALCLAFTAAKAQRIPEARKILDEAASLFTDKGGVEVAFKADNFSGGDLQGNTTGTMRIQGDKFRMATPDMIIWFNGETQWSYVKASNEVNVSVPTREERQGGMTPHAFVDLYKEGYDYRIKETTLRGKGCHEITLTAHDRRKEPRVVILDIDKGNRGLMCIRMLQGKKGQWIRISIRRLRTGLSFAATDFEFDPEEYPQAEIIDLR